jgi:hypothetical protein
MTGKNLENAARATKNKEKKTMTYVLKSMKKGHLIST